MGYGYGDPMRSVRIMFNKQVIPLCSHVKMMFRMHTAYHIVYSILETRRATQRDIVTGFSEPVNSLARGILQIYKFTVKP